MSAGNEETIVVTHHPRHPSVVTLRLNRPHKKNALRPDDVRVLAGHFARLQVDPEVKLVILTGTADAFCAGADINELNALSGDAMASFIEMQVDFLGRIVMSPKIVVAAVNGVTSGLGNHIVTCCDLAYMRAGSVLHFTGASKAIPSLLMGTLVMPMTIGLKRAKSLYLRGGKLSAEQACADGLCNAVVAPEEWENELDKLAAEFAVRASSTMAHNKFQLNQGVYQMLGPLKLSALAGGSYLSARGDIPTGKMPVQEKP